MSRKWTFPGFLGHQNGQDLFSTIQFRWYPTNMNAINRNLEPQIKKLLKTFPIVAILGVRQCGRSTLAKKMGKGWKYFDLERPSHFTLINDDPELFFRENDNRIIIDEAQNSAGIFPVLRSVVDENRHKKGQFLLTGSSSFELRKNISESLAGRVAIVELSTLKMNEFKAQKTSSLYNIFNKKLSKKDLPTLKRLKPTKTFHEIKHYMLRGGYPEPVLKGNLDFHLAWMENYFNTYLNRDMRALFPNIDILKYQRVIRMLSSVSGTIVNKAEIARSVEASEKSIRDYLQIISGTFVWRELPAYRTSKIKTTISSPKGHYRDSGLLLYLQNVFSAEELNVYPRLGNIFESFVIEELIRGVQTTNARNVTPWHFRTKAGAEIDLVLEGSFGLIPIEIKYSSITVKKQLLAMTNFLKLHKLPYGIVVNNCTTPSLVTEDIIQIPAGCL